MHLRVSLIKDTFESQNGKDLMILYFSTLSVWKKKPLGDAFDAML